MLERTRLCIGADTAENRGFNGADTAENRGFNGADTAGIQILTDFNTRRYQNFASAFNLRYN